MPPITACVITGRLLYLQQQPYSKKLHTLDVPIPKCMQNMMISQISNALKLATY